MVVVVVVLYKCDVFDSVVVDFLNVVEGVEVVDLMEFDFF